MVHDQLVSHIKTFHTFHTLPPYSPIIFENLDEIEYIGVEEKVPTDDGFEGVDDRHSKCSRVQTTHFTPTLEVKDKDTDTENKYDVSEEEGKFSD